MEEIVEKLSELNKTVASMESCTGGGLANMITNIPGASDVFKFGAVTYSNEYKIKMGVSEEVITRYSVYSKKTAREMSKNIAEFAKANYGIGVTGKLNRADKNNLVNEDNLVYFCIYDYDDNKYYDFNLKVVRPTRKECKKEVIDKIIEEFKKIIC